MEEIDKLATDFAKAAQHYCQGIEGRDQATSTESFLMMLYPIIAELCYRATILPHREPEREDLMDSGQLPDDKWQEIYKSLEMLLGKYNIYWEVFDPRTKEEPVAGSLADGLADIYRDLKPGLETIGSISGPIPIDVIWDWRFGFISHWGQHALEALRAIHANALDLWVDGWD